MKPDYVYVASSWRNPIHIAVCAALRSAGIDHYDFKNPPSGTGGFHWSSVMPSYQKVGPGSPRQRAKMDEYIEALKNPIAEKGFADDMGALHKADCVVLVLPCGNSAHLELGYAVGAGKATAILLDPDSDDMIEPDLMYKMVDYVSPSLFDLLGWLGVED